jgi:hypothetical protein
MFYKLLAAAALSLTVATGAIAQDDSQGGEEGQIAGDSNEITGDFTSSTETQLTDDDRLMMEGWDETTTGVFFTDNTMAMMRSQDEIMTNWASLSADQQASVRESCAAVDAGGRNFSASVVAFCGWVRQ